MRKHFTKQSWGVAAASRTRGAWLAGTALLLMAILAPIAQFGVLEALVLPQDASATVDNVVASPDMFRLAGMAYGVVALLDVLVAWALHVVFRRVNVTASLVTAWLRTGYAAVLAVASVSLFQVGRLGAGGASTLSAGQVEEQILSSLGSFHTSYEEIGLSIFAFHLFGVGYLVYKAAGFPKVLGGLVMVAGAGYLSDSVGQMLIPNFSMTVAQFTFVGEALLIFWLFWRAAKGFPNAGPTATAATVQTGDTTEPVSHIT